MFEADRLRARREMIVRHCVFWAALSACSTLHAADYGDYALGQGLVVGDFLFSGYANVTTELPRTGPREADLDDFSLFVAGRVNRWVSPFVEVELSSLTLAQQAGARRELTHFVRERIYNDWRIDDANTLRIGKILAPVGEWNLIHAAPLVLTATQPLTTQRGFANYTSGLSWLQETPATSTSPDWQIYVQPGGEWPSRPRSVADRQFRNVYGAHLNWDFGLDNKAGLSFQHGQMIDSGETYALAGFNVQHRFGRLMLESEATTAQWSGDSVPRAHDVERGIYGLADYSFAPGWHGIVEGEYFQDHQEVHTSRNVLVGMAYKPRPAVVWKLEYVYQTGVSEAIPTGVQAAFAVLF